MRESYSLSEHEVCGVMCCIAATLSVDVSVSALLSSAPGSQLYGP